MTTTTSIRSPAGPPTGSPDPPSTLSRPSTRRDDIAAAFFSVWVVVGLFLDGWAHNAGKPESFWTPWHAVMYSGFVAGALWYVVDDLRQRRHGSASPPDPLVVAGLGVFALAGVADMAWHTVFGVEEDVEALLSPSHLALMVAGLLLVTNPVRNARARAEWAPPWRTFAPAAIGLTLTVAIVAFFLQFASALHVVDHGLFAAGAPDGAQVRGIVGILLVNALLLAAVTWTLQRWAGPPVGTFTLVLGGTALLMAGLDGFAQVALVVPVALAGAVADGLHRRGARLATTLTVTPIVLWAGWFAAYHAVWGLGWAPELWTGSIVLTALTGLGVSLLGASPADLTVSVPAGAPAAPLRRRFGIGATNGSVPG